MYLTDRINSLQQNQRPGLKMVNYPTKYVLIAADDHAASEAIRNCLQPHYQIHHASRPEQLFEMFSNKRYEFTFMDIAMLMSNISGQPEQKDYQKAISSFRKIFPAADIIVMSAHETIRDAVCAVKAGANNYITYPVNPEEIKYVIEMLEGERKKQSELDYLRDQFWESEAREIVQTRNPLMQNVFSKIRSVAKTRSTVMLYGETGTGKGVLARLIHAHSNRRNNQFISVHCGAIPDNLIESELFGHEKGAFTGAVKRKLGKFEIADGGTIFLDEIGTISNAAQIKLLHVLQDRTFNRLGGDQNLTSDARIIAATNADLKAMSESGNFRKDLYYRLNVFPIEIPPLRERKEDIPQLIKIFLKQLNMLYSKEIHDVHPLVSEAFHAYSWPGNIRELENLIERAHILETTNVLTPESFPRELFEQDDAAIAQIELQPSQSLSEVRRKAIENIERQYLKEILTIHKGRINLSAAAAGISTRQFHKLLAKYGIKKEDFK